MSKLSKWQSDIFDGLSQITTTGPDGQPRGGRMTSSALSLRILWGFHLASPPIVFLAALDGGRARSADEALGAAFIDGNLFLVAVGLGLFVAVASVKSRLMNRREKALAVLLALGVVPLTLLMWAAASAVGGWPRRQYSSAAIIGAVVLHAAWMAVLVAGRAQMKRARALG